MPSGDLEPYARGGGNVAAATLTLLRQRAFPQLIQPPRFMGRERTLPGQPDWLGRMSELVTGRAALIAALAGLALLVLSTLPAWALSGGSATSISPLRSSAGVTGTAATTVEDLSATTMLGRIPFVQQQRYLTGVTGAKPAALVFIDGARQAEVAQYVQEVGTLVTLPYVSDAVSTKEAVAAWGDAVAKVQQQAAAAAEAKRLAAIRSSLPASVWQAPALRTGTAIPGTTVTFYACIGNGFCNIMASGLAPFDGAAACSYDLPFGTRFVINGDPSGRTFVCLDRGALAPTWVDIWFYDVADGWAWQSNIGTSGAITIVD